MLTHLNNHDDPEHPLSIFTIQTFLIFHSISSKKIEFSSPSYQEKVIPY